MKGSGGAEKEERPVLHSRNIRFYIPAGYVPCAIFFSFPITRYTANTEADLLGRLGLTDHTIRL